MLLFISHLSIWVGQNWTPMPGQYSMPIYSHTFATRLAQAGVDLYRIAKLLGHNDISTTQRYAHHCPESLRSGVDVLQNYYNSTTVGSEGDKEAVHVSG
jgi:integrase